MTAFEIFYYFLLPAAILLASYIARKSLSQPAQKSSARPVAPPPLVIIRANPQDFTRPKAANE
ncbi:hypothetical protein R1A27_22195 [Methylobacterium sp. NMS12]|uniref:hypothetical protein n=1 Tax=Methylobacterium sp. NMS12 TaxID=3079766 RepID=UPI003F8807B8